MSDLITMMSAAAGQVGGINPREHFNTVLYTGTGSNQSITGLDFQPDLLWFKSRGQAYGHVVYDAVRGRSYGISTNSTSGESPSSASNDLVSFDSNGFTVGPFENWNSINNTLSNPVAWAWKANGAGVSNTAGTISSTVSANTTAGISIVTFTGNDSAVTVGHGLGVAPKMIIVKVRNQTTAWWVYHASLGATSRIQLNETSAEFTGTTLWDSTAPTSTVFSISTGGQNNNPYIAYCFAEVEGFSKFGSYTGNGSATGPSVTTGFLPSFLMIKRTDSTGDWIIHDSARDASNPRTEYLEPNTSDAEATGNDVDFNSTGFQLKSTSATINASGGTYIYACFA